MTDFFPDDRIDIDIDEPTHERIVAYAERTGQAPEAVLEQALADEPPPLPADPLTAAHDAIRGLLVAFRREMEAGYTTPEQQAALWRAKAVIA